MKYPTTKNLLRERYRLSISVQLPKIATEGEMFSFRYLIKNIGKNDFPGGEVVARMFWPIVGPNYFVNHPIDVEPLKLGDTYISQEFKDTPLVAGYTIFTHAPVIFKAKDGEMIELYLEDGKTLAKNRPIAGIRARSHEEISQKQAVWIAIISLSIVALFEVVSIVVTFLKP